MSTATHPITTIQSNKTQLLFSPPFIKVDNHSHIVAKQSKKQNVSTQSSAVNDYSNNKKNKERISIPSQLYNAVSFQQKNSTTIENNHHHQNNNNNKLLQPISIIAQLSGEMGNNLDKISFARIVQIMAQEMYPDMSTQLIFRHQESIGTKWERAKNDIKECFPQFETYNFEIGNSVEFSTRKRQQELVLGGTMAKKLHLKSRPGQSVIRTAIQTIHDVIPLFQSNNEIITLPENANISLPFILTDSFAVFDLIDTYYDDIRHFLRFNDSACCKQIPKPDESVFHFRNFIAEMPNAASKYGYDEVSPNQTANLLFGHLPPGSKVAITTRFHDDNVQQYVNELIANKLMVRVIQNQSGVQDFCFLLKTQKELGGMSRSTYFTWAALLSKNVSRVYMYTIHSPGVKELFKFPKANGIGVSPKDGISFVKCHWNHKTLQDRIQCQLYEIMED